MAKAYDDESNERLRELAKKVMRERCDGKGVRLAELLNVSPAFISEFLNGKRGAGLETLIGLGRFAPLELLTILGIEPGVVVTLLEDVDWWLGKIRKRLSQTAKSGERPSVRIKSADSSAG